jgi:hypothetical protein
MSGLVDYGIIDPNQTNALVRGYDAAVDRRVQREEQQAKLDQLKSDRQLMVQFQEQLKAAGKDPDLGKVFDALIATGRPDYVMSGIEGKQRLKAQTDFERTGRDLYPELFGGAAPPPAAPGAPFAPRAPAVPTPGGGEGPFAAPALGTGMYGTGVMAPAAPTNALAPAAPTNALAKTPEQLRREIMFFSQSTDPRAKAMAGVLTSQLTEMTKPYVVGGNLVTGAGQTLFTAPPSAQQTQLSKLYAERDALPPNDPRRASYDALIRKETTHGPGTTLNLPPQEKEEQGARGKMLVDQYGKVSDQAGIAIKTIPSIQSNLAILDKGFDTGFGTETQAAGAKVLGALGVKDAEKYATNAQTFSANATQAVLQKQLEQKGPQTESDAQRITQIGAQLGNTKEANKILLTVAQEQLKRDVEQRNFYDKWWKANKTYDGAEEAWYAGDGGKSLFDRPALKDIGKQADKRKPLGEIFPRPKG